MPVVTEGQWVVEMLARIERALGDLYTRFAARLPDHASFWAHLADDEIKHTEWVHGLQAEIDAGLVTAVAARANRELYQAFLDDIRNRLVEADRHSLTQYRALSAARYLESTYLEKCFLDVFETDSPGVKRILTALADNTERHREVIEQSWRDTQPEE